MPELVLYGIRELAEQHYEALDQRETSLDIPRPMRVDQAGKEEIVFGSCYTVLRQFF